MTVTLRDTSDWFGGGGSMILARTVGALGYDSK
jgi:hypothetical protein